MKKLVLSVMVFAMASSAMAIIQPTVFTAKAKIKLTSADLNTSNLYLAQSDEYEVGLNLGSYSEIMNLAEYDACFYAIYNATNYDSFGTKKLGAMALGFKADGSASYTLDFSKVEGAEQLYLVDHASANGGDSVIAIANTKSYTFTASASSESRFALYIQPAAFEICFKYNHFTIANYRGDVTIFNAADATVYKEFLDVESVDEDFTGKTGSYVVRYTDPKTSEETSVIFNASPEVTPAN